MHVVAFPSSCGCARPWGWGKRAFCARPWGRRAFRSSSGGASCWTWPAAPPWDILQTSSMTTLYRGRMSWWTAVAMIDQCSSGSPMAHKHAISYISIRTASSPAAISCWSSTPGSRCMADNNAFPSYPTSAS
jgi:hypothetical protein